MKKVEIFNLSKSAHLFEGPCHPPPGCSLGSSHKGSSLHETGWSTLSISSEILDLTLLLFPRSCHNLRGEACPLRVERKLVIVVAKVELFFACFIHISTKKTLLKSISAGSHFIIFYGHRKVFLLSKNLLSSKLLFWLGRKVNNIVLTYLHTTNLT